MVTRQEMLDLGIKFIQETGLYPAARTRTKRDHGCSRDKIYDEFDNSWNNYLNELSKLITIPDRKPTSVKKWSKKDIINKIIESSIETGYPDYLKFVHDKTFPSLATVRDRFGTWLNAIRQAGFETEKENIIALGKKEDVVASLLTELDFKLPKTKKFEDAVSLICNGIKVAKWNSKTATLFTNQFSFKKRNKSIRTWFLEHFQMKWCSKCDLVYYSKYFSENQSWCKSCCKAIDYKPYAADTRAKKAKIKWADKNKINLIYFECPKEMEVDHIIPLKGKYICGFHIETNLQYLTKKDNGKKNNYHISEEYWKDESTFVNGPKIQFEFNRFWEVA